MREKNVHGVLQGFPLLRLLVLVVFEEVVNLGKLLLRLIPQVEVQRVL